MARRIQVGKPTRKPQSNAAPDLRTPSGRRLPY
jgi:hypothetical protein